MLPSCNFFLVVDDLKNIDHLERCIERSDEIVIFVRRCVTPMTHTRGRPAPLRLQVDALTRRACSCCRELAPHLRRRVDALVGELEGGDITAGDRAHIAGDLLATCPAITDRERSILEWQIGWMLFCETGGRSARGIALA